MPSFDLPTPPSKKRKVNTTYGSQSMVTRALRAVKNAVPGKILSLNNEHTETLSSAPEETEQGLHTPLSSESIERDTARLQKPSDGPNGVCKDKPKPNGKRSGDNQNQCSGRRTSKRLIDNNKVPTETPSRKKRRKHKTSVEAERPEEIRALAEQVNPLITGPPSDVKVAPSNYHQQGASDGDNALNSQISPHSNAHRSSTRNRRRPRRFASEAEEKSSIGSPPQKARGPKTPTSTPSRKRGRPRKHPDPAPTLDDDEEIDLGFRRINKEDVQTTPTQHNAQNNHEMAWKKQSSSGKESRPHCGQHLADCRNSSGMEDGKTEPKEAYPPFNVSTLKPRTKGVDDILHGQGMDAGEWFEHQNDLQVPETLRNSITKLQRILKDSSAESINQFKTDLLRGLSSRHPLVHMEEEYRKVEQLVTQTVLAGEGNSMLVIGPRGCGKTALVERVLSELDHEHHDDFIVVRLNGFMHTDDKLALRDIWRQLGREVAADEDAGGIRTNYADTLTSLLALLAHSAENEGKENEIARSVIFVIDEFDLFATHPRQTLLYNLFDVAQSRNAPIAVLGLTTRTDIVESLEKRVKSRFGQRYVYLTHPKTFNSFREICRSVMIGREPADQAFSDRLGSGNLQVKKLRPSWEEYVDALFTHDSQFESFLRHLFARGKCVPSFLSGSLLPISLLTASDFPTGASFIERSLLPSDSKLQLLPSLSDLELSLLIAAARLDVILDTDVCNIAMVYEEYMQLASRSKVQSSAAGQTAIGGGARVWGKEAALGSWEKLMELGLVLPASTGMGDGGSGGMFRVDVALEEIGPSCPRMGATMSKWCKEI
ncbi:MAG: hypothetical protein Q9225_005841 [Loekoesia sp. 1 TL-2023]